MADEKRKILCILYIMISWLKLCTLINKSFYNFQTSEKQYYLNCECIIKGITNIIQDNYNFNVTTTPVITIYDKNSNKKMLTCLTYWYILKL